VTPVAPAIRRALPRESELLTRIAQAAKREWNYPESWIEAWRDHLTISAAYIADNDVYVIEDGGEVKGFHAVSMHGSAAWLEHLWVAPESMRQGLGRELFVHATRTARARGASEIQIESDPNAEGFYLKMGARRVGEIKSTIAGEPRSVPRLIFWL
jgi:GNAT superfamily N-acetyltransferase